MATKARGSLSSGTRLGRYEIIGEIASGGMAMVYLGRALGAAGFQRLVAIKLMHAQYAHDEDFVGMFLDEARLAARIRHPNAVATLDLENGDDGLYLVMEFVEGDTMLSLLRAASKENTRIAPPLALRIVLDMLNGLHAAHELTGDRGEPLKLVHRDVSPHNVLVGLDGISRITDFGIARAEERVSSTRDGQVKGKLAYMAPEQTSGQAIDRRVDVFATGIVLWESLTGRRLFGGQSDGEVLRALLVNPIPRLRDVTPDLPAALEEVCSKALARDPDQRFATAAQFADALEDAGGSIGIGSARAVSQFVRKVSGPKIAAMQERVRIGMSADATGATSAVRRKEHTDPDRTTQRSEADLQLGQDGGSGRMAPSAIAPAGGSNVGPLTAPAAPGSNRATALVAIGAIALLGAFGLLLFRLRVPAPAATRDTTPAVVAPAQPAPPAQHAQELAVPIVPAAPVVVPTTPVIAAVSPPEAAAPEQPGPHLTVRRPASRRAPPRRQPGSGATPASSSGGGGFNPEAM